LQVFYVQKAARLLSNNNTQLANNLVEKIQRILSPKSIGKIDSNKDNDLPQLPTDTLLTMAEEILLKIYLNEPDYRLKIIDRLDSNHLTFTVPHYQWLWEKIMHYTEVGILDYYDQELIIKLQDLNIEFTEEMNRLNHLFISKESDRSQLQRTTLVIQAAIACLEKIHLEKQRKDYLVKWEETGDQTYYEGFYQTNQRLKEVEKVRLFTIDELLY
jgi:DNA primase